VGCLPAIMFGFIPSLHVQDASATLPTAEPTDTSDFLRTQSVNAMKLAIKALSGAKL
jgi:hypothetical protein